MAKINYKFLLKKGIIRIVEPSNNFKDSYFEMSDSLELKRGRVI